MIFLYRSFQETGQIYYKELLTNTKRGEQDSKMPRNTKCRKKLQLAGYRSVKKKEGSGKKTVG